MCVCVCVCVICWRWATDDSLQCVKLHTLSLTPQSVNLKGSAVELLEAMLEETNEKTKDLVREIVNAVQIEALHDTLVEFYELMNDQAVKDAGFDDEAETGLFRTYHVLVHLTDYGVPQEKIGEID